MSRLRTAADRLEDERMVAVRRYDLLDTPPYGAFDRIAELTARLFDVPIAIVSIVDTDRVLFKAKQDLADDQPGREPGLCALAVRNDDVRVVTDALDDLRTLADPLVAGSLGFQFYAGTSLTTRDGYRLGTLCVIDWAPRAITETETATLSALGEVMMDELELRLSTQRTEHEGADRQHKAEVDSARMEQIAKDARAGLESNRQIGKAVGLMMAYYGLSEDEALAKLKGHSQDLNIKLRLIADEILANHHSTEAADPP